MRLRTKFVLLLLLIGLFLASIAGFNILMDPYRFFGTPDIDGVNKYKPHFFFGQILAKPSAVRRGGYDGLILGSSRAGSGFSLDHPGWEGLNGYNYALPGVSPDVMWRSFQHAKANGDLKRVLISLDFYMYNIGHGHQNEIAFQGYDERLSVTELNETNLSYTRRLTDLFTSLFSSAQLSQSWSTLTQQAKMANGEARVATIYPSGFWVNEPPLDFPQRKFFKRVERHYMSTTWFPAPERTFTLIDESNESKLRFLKNILDDCYQNNIEVTLLFTPIHARLNESMRAVGLWPLFEQWKREVLLVNEAAAVEAGRPPYPVWDFTGYNSITMEPVPALDDIETRMQWHNDATHMTKASGDLIQDIIWGTTDASDIDFGRKVSSGNVDAVLAGINASRKAYVEKFPADVREIKELAQKTRNKRVEPVIEGGD